MLFFGKGDLLMAWYDGISFLEMQDIAKRRKKAIIMAAVLAVTATATIRQVDAVYAVHDNKVYMQIVEQIKKATQQITELKKQYDLQMQNMESLKREHVDPIMKDIVLIQDEYAKLKKESNGLLSGAKSGADSFKEVFQDFKNLDLKKVSMTHINGQVDSNRQSLESSNKQLIELINHKQKELEKSNERLTKLQNLISTTKGEKAIADLNAEIALESVRANNINSEISALQLRQKAIQSQVDKLEKDAAAALNQKASDEFKEAGEKMVKEGESAVSVKTQSGTFRRLVESKGWF